MAGRHFLLRHSDLLLAVALTVAMTTEVLLWGPFHLLAATAASVLAALPLALRRATPLVSFLLVSSGVSALLLLAPDFDNHSAILIAVFFVALYSLGRHSTGHEAWLGALAVLVAVVMFVLYDDPDIQVSSVVFALVFLGGPWASGVAIRERREREIVLTTRARELERDQVERARQAVATERARIARELHDVVSHAIAISVLQARGGRKMLGVDQDAVRRSLDAIEHTNTQALADMRRLLSLLRETDDPGGNAPAPSLARLEALLGELRDSGLPVTLSVTGTGTQVPPGVDTSAYRIIQEALTNVVKHAGPATASVSIAYGIDDLEIVVANTGSAPANGSSRGLGLVGIRERVAVTGGHVSAGPGPKGGFVVTAQLPYGIEP
jgi:signal transduction histidine kinase